MSVVSDIVNLILFDLCEDPPIGPILGVITLNQLIDSTNLTCQDFIQRTCFSSLIQTQYVQAGTGRFTFPDVMMRVDHAFLAGVLLEPTTVQALNNGFVRWRTELGLPTRWHADELALKTIELAAIPNDTGVFVPGPNEPDPPFAQTGWDVVLDSVTYTPDSHRDLTLIGPQMPAAVTQLADPICFGTVGSPTSYVPQDLVLGFLGFGVLARIFSSDSELKDNYRAVWCAQEYELGVALMKSIMDEASGSDQ